MCADQARGSGDQHTPPWQLRGLLDTLEVAPNAVASEAEHGANARHDRQRRRPSAQQVKGQAPVDRVNDFRFCSVCIKTVLVVPCPEGPLDHSIGEGVAVLDVKMLGHPRRTERPKAHLETGLLAVFEASKLDWDEPFPFRHDANEGLRGIVPRPQQRLRCRHRRVVFKDGHDQTLAKTPVAAGTGFERWPSHGGTLPAEPAK